MTDSQMVYLRQAVTRLAADAWAETDVEPESETEAAMAVAFLGKLLDEQEGSKHQALQGQLDNADMLSSDPLQVLSELVQNADDAGASEIRFGLKRDELVVAHDGRPVKLRDLQFLALPGLSGKRLDPVATGRFGIGLSTIRSLTNIWEIHQGPFRVQFNGSALRPAEAFDASGATNGPKWTVFRIPLTKRKVTPDELNDWFSKWDSAALLFLRSVRTVTVTTQGKPARVLSVAVREHGSLTAVIGTGNIRVNIVEAEFYDGARWHVFQADVPIPAGLARRHKSSADMMSLGVGLPDAPIKAGVIHSGLPVAGIPAMARVNGLFETLTNRQDFIDGDWNDAVCDLAAQLWAASVCHMLEQASPQAWHLVPVGAEARQVSSGLPERLVSQMLQLARANLAPELRLRTPRRTQRHLQELAIEEEALTPVVSGSNIAAVAGQPAVFPTASRDRAGRWRTVVSDWRQANQAGIPEEVTVSDALALLHDGKYPVTDVIRLAACAVERRAGHLLAGTYCLVATDGKRYPPPGKAELAMVFSTPAPEATLLSLLPGSLGFTITLHDAYYAETREASAVRQWLRELDCLVDPGDARAMLNRVAAYAQKGGRLPDPPHNDEALRTLLIAMRQVDDRTRRRVGAEIGKALRLRAISYTEGEQTDCFVQANQAYLPAALDTRQRSLAEAAGAAADLMWISPEYRKTLRMRGDDHGLTVGGFFRLLGVADAPRLFPTDFGYNKGYARDPRSGFPAHVSLSPRERDLILARKGASYTLDDQFSPHIEAIARHIAEVPDGERRRKRALSLLDTLRRANLLTGPASKVKAASPNYVWDLKGTVWPIWAWRLRTINWIDDSHGTPVRPDRLHHKTKAAVALYGADDPGYLHPDFDSFAARHSDCLSLLGIAGDPTRPQLIQRLRDLKKRWAKGNSDEIRAEVHVVYQVMAQAPAGLAAGVRTLPIPPLEALILSDQGWFAAREVFRGPSFLAGYRPFVPAGDQLAPLWTILDVPFPSAHDFIEVLKTIASKEHRPDTSDQTVVLEGLRHLNTLLTEADPREIDIGLRSSLRSLPIWTASGWSKQRPRYITASRELASRLSPSLTVWEPGGQLDLAPETLQLLDVTSIDLTHATADTSLPSTLNEELTDRFRRTILHFQDEIARFEPQAAGTFTGWSWLANLDVHLTPGLRITFPVEPQELTIPIGAHVDKADGILHIGDYDDIRTAAGEAIAAHFAINTEHVAMRWTRLWDRDSTRETPSPTPMITSQQREALAQQELAAQLNQRNQHPQQASPPPRPPGPPPASNPPAKPQPSPASTGSGSPPPRPPARELVNAGDLELDSPAIHAHGGEASTSNHRSSQRPSRGRLPDPRIGGATPRQHLGPRAYTDLERENLAMELLRAALRARGRTLHDYRAQPGLGADAADSADDYYEIKAHAGPEPDAISITMSQLQRAYQHGQNFHLVIASNLEYGNGEPTLRIIKDPLRVLAVDTHDSIRLYGLHKPDLPATEVIFAQRRKQDAT